MSTIGNSHHKINTMKRNLTLDFNQAKKASLAVPSATSAILSSPDLNMLKVGTPELEKMILDTGMVNTPTPGPMFPTTRGDPEDPETFASGFVNALNNLHNNASQSKHHHHQQQQLPLPQNHHHHLSLSPPPLDSSLSSLGAVKLIKPLDKLTASDSSSGGTVYAELEQTQPQQPPFLPPLIKEEPQTVPNIHGPSSPPMSPVDMEAQERIKLERKRQRNRLAASKCRTRKLERISRLEDKVKFLKNENVELASLINQLKEHVGLLKVEVMDHVHAGCQIMG